MRGKPNQIPLKERRPPCATLNGEGVPCPRPAKNGDIYCKIHRRCECCDNKCKAMTRLCGPCLAAGCELPPGPPRDPGEWATAKSRARKDALKAGLDPRYEISYRKIEP